MTVSSELNKGISITLLQQADKLFDWVKPSARYEEEKDGHIVAMCGIRALQMARNKYQAGMRVNEIILFVAEDHAYKAMVYVINKTDHDAVVNFFARLPSREEISDMFSKAQDYVRENL